ncbi:helix-turn-helix domain-containing protein [Actinoplanes oblitus]|uniref:Helix-turn-helix domain-containing protein n=1 Tax=Actinoplanes oblitus TaxID=3040509 RepID=A0ABY8WW16_9ACTN|nr:transcriptional regulator [Actinoplanes oblitus]WIN00336.1 helix-turn-helix domain-containing protein [Actinoplanes oblitus]
MTTEDVGARIRHLRLAHGLTQRELAAPHYSRALLAAVEAGTRNPSDQVISHVAGRFGIDPDDLRYGRPPGAVADLDDALRQARQALSQGKAGHAEDVFRRVHADATRYALPAPACWAAYWLGEARMQRGDMRGAQEQFGRMLADAGCPPVPRAAALARWAYCRFAGGDSFTATAVLQDELRAMRESGTPDPDARLRLSTVLLYLFVELDWRQRAHELEADLLGLVPHVTNPEWLAHFFMTAGQLRRGAAELAEAERLFGEAGRVYRELGLTKEIGLCHWAYGYVLRRVDRLAEAATEFGAAAEILLAVGATQDHAGVTLELAEVRRRQGALDEAERLARVAARVSAQVRHVECMAEADRVLGLVAVDRGAIAEGERLLAEAADRYENGGFVTELIRTCRMLGDVLIGAGRTAEAGAVLRRGLRAAERSR